MVGGGDIYRGADALTQSMRDLGLYNTFIPILRRINQAGWEPIPHAAATDRAVWLERFGAGGKGFSAGFSGISFAGEGCFLGGW